MADETPIGDQGAFDAPTPSPESASVLGGDTSSVMTTAARALVLGNALATPEALDGVTDDLPELGLERLPSVWGGWKNRIAFVDRSDAILRDAGVLDSVQERERARYRASGGTPARTAREPLWRQVTETGDPATTIAWLRSVMTDDEPVAAAAAASALSNWRRNPQFEVPESLEAARDLVDVMQADQSLAGEIARASARQPARPVGAARPDRSPEPVSAMVHGTFAYAGNWWYPGGDFHQFVREGLCSHLYNGGASYSWNGAYTAHSRAVAAQRLADWMNETSPEGLCCVFAHSYGGTIALHSTAYGARFKNVILLSAPVETVPVEWRNIDRAISIRIHWDLVLLAARRKQLFRENVEEFHVPRWFVNHADSHEPNVWTTFGLAALAALEPH